MSISRTITLRNFYEYAKKRDGRVGFNFQKCRRRPYLQSPLTRVSRKSAPAHDSQKKPFFSISSTSLLPMIKYVTRYCIIGMLFTSLFSVDHGYRVPRISGSSTLITRKFAWHRYSPPNKDSYSYHRSMDNLVPNLEGKSCGKYALSLIVLGFHLTTIHFSGWLGGSVSQLTSGLTKIASHILAWQRTGSHNTRQPKVSPWSALSSPSIASVAPTMASPSRRPPYTSWSAPASSKKCVYPAPWP